MSKVKSVQPNDWQYPVMENYRMICCGCGLSHNMDFQVFEELEYPGKESQVVPLTGYAVRLRARVNSRSTAAMRREDRKRKKYRYRNLTEINLTIEGPDDYKEQVKTLVREMVKHNLLTSDTSDVALAFIEERDETGNPKEAAGTEG